MSDLMRDDPYSEDHLREVLSLMERPEMRSKLVQQISEEQG
jgi:hypothetical protein